MTKEQALYKALIARQLAQQKREEARRLPHAPRRAGLLAWARQFEAEADRTETHWSIT